MSLKISNTEKCFIPSNKNCNPNATMIRQDSPLS